MTIVKLKTFERLMNTPNVKYEVHQFLPFGNYNYAIQIDKKELGNKFTIKRNTIPYDEHCYRLKEGMQYNYHEIVIEEIYEG